ncbi:hypothetical protein DYB26_011623 [Aphanomyces astaci]|uniref:EF-hand domain-containing protein n=1 Tax=Aphanomyces astaci TaxID=112090 RepID=A0A3R7B9T6_APHAT|nr:hypothetical protein DYB26_011623 [Aphanomyces astaci]
MNQAESQRLLAEAAAPAGGGNIYGHVETSRVLLFMFAVLVFVICLEMFLHFLEHITKRKPKYADMLHKTTQELMIVGLIYLIVKLCVSTGLAKANGMVYQAVDFADLIILFTVLSMVVQATVILFMLRKTNREMGKISILRTDNVLANARTELDAVRHLSRLQRRIIWSKYEYQLQMKLLRSLFLRSYELPQLFPFDKYIEDVQDSQMAHLVYIDISMWMVLMATYALFFIFSGEFFSHGEFKANSTVRWGVFACFASSLLLFMVLMYVYLRHLVHLLLRHAAKKECPSSSWLEQYRIMATPDALIEVLSHVVHYEASIPPMPPQEAIDCMRTIADNLCDNDQANHPHQSRHHHGCLEHLFAHDLLCGLLGTLYRHLGRTTNRPKQSKLQGVDALHLPWFSRKLVHFLVQLLFVINGFYYALFINCVLYLDGFNAYAVVKATVVLVPLLLNTFVVAPKITREFSVINSLFRVDAHKLSAIVEHFAEVEDMKVDMVRQVWTYLHSANQSVADIAAALVHADASDDEASDGYVDMDVLRTILKQFGFRFPRQKFTTLVRLQFNTKGTTIRYQDLLTLLGESETNVEGKTNPSQNASFLSSHQPTYPYDSSPYHEIPVEPSSRSWHKTQTTELFFI